MQKIKKISTIRKKRKRYICIHTKKELAYILKRRVIRCGTLLVSFRRTTYIMTYVDQNKNDEGKRYSSPN